MIRSRSRDPRGAPLAELLGVKLSVEMMRALEEEARSANTSPAGILRSVYQDHLDRKKAAPSTATAIERLAHELLGPMGSDMPALLEQSQLRDRQPIVLQHLLLALRKALKQPATAAEALAVLKDEDDSPLYLAVRK